MMSDSAIRGTSAPAETPGRVLGNRYELLEVLGHGAMGAVHRARDRELDRVVAIKTIHPAGASADAIARRLQYEAAAAARLSHPGIVTIHDVALGGEPPYIVMEYCKGRTLTEVIAGGPLPPDQAVRVALQVCQALQYAHAEGVMHRDIKSSNIMVDDAWRVKLADFGVARVSDREATHLGLAVGTPAYMAPEQVLGAVTDVRSDVFSLGVVLYEALAGSRPFGGDDFAKVVDEVMNLDPIPPRERNFAVSPALDAVVRRALSKAPDDRYPDAAAFAEALGQTLDPALTTSLRQGVGRSAGIAAMLLLSVAVVGTATGLVLGVGTGKRPGRAPASQAAAIAAPAETPAPAPVVTVPVAEPPASVELEPPRVAAVVAENPPARRRAPRQPAPVASPPAAAEPPKLACVSVNAVPYAVVVVDGRPMGETPRACLWLTAGRHRVVFESENERSPEQVIVLDEEHTADNPLRLSYDFRARQFLAR
jgi:serine/threonine-protein kinase